MSQRNTIEIKPRPTELSDAQNIIHFVNKTTIETFGPDLKEIGKLIQLM